MHKYVRTPHIRGSRFQHGDHDMEAVPFEELAGRHLVVEEKMDGANCAVSFDEHGELLLQSRGHYLRGGPRERHFAMLKQWASSHVEALYCALGDRYVMYGEWLYAKHTCFYDLLPHYFMEFDVLDTTTGAFLDSANRRALLKSTPVVPVRELRRGPFKNLHCLEIMINESYFMSEDRGAWTANLALAAEHAGVTLTDALEHTDSAAPLMEGLYIKWEDDGVVKGRYKFVRNSFTSAVLDQKTHWHDRPIIQNGLRPGALEAMFTSA